MNYKQNCIGAKIIIKNPSPFQTGLTILPGRKALRIMDSKIAAGFRKSAPSSINAKTKMPRENPGHFLIYIQLQFTRN